MGPGSARRAARRDHRRAEPQEARSSIRDALVEYLAASEPLAQSAGAEVEELVLEIVDGDRRDRS
jgi:hypothetical protein